MGMGIAVIPWFRSITTVMETIFAVFPWEWGQKAW